MDSGFNREVSELLDAVEAGDINFEELVEKLRELIKGTTMYERWYSPRNMIPFDSQRVLTMDSAGYVHEGVYYRGLWYDKDMAMYSYSTPLFWRSLDKD